MNMAVGGRTLMVAGRTWGSLQDNVIENTQTTDLY